MRRAVLITFITALSACTDVVYLNNGTPTPTPPAAPTGVTGTAHVSSISLAWQPNAGTDAVDYYNVYGAQGAWTTWASTLPGATIDTGLACCSFLRNELEDEKSYSLAVTAVNAGGESALSVQRTLRPPGWIGRRQIGTPTTDSAWGIDVDSQLNVSVFGHTAGALEGTNAGGNDAFAMSLSGEGRARWILQEGSSASEQVFGGDVGPDGYVHVAGYTPGSLQGSNLGLNDAVLIRYGSNSSLSWIRQFGTTASEDARAVATHGTSRIVVVGRTAGVINGSNAGNFDVYFSVFDPSGNVLLSRQIGSTQIDTAAAVAVDADGNIFIGGTTQGTLPGETDQGAPFDAFLAKYTSTGNLDILDQFRTGSVDALAICGDGSLVMAGNDGGAFVRRVSNAGSEIWTQMLSSSTEQAFGIATEPVSCTIYVCGSTTGSLGGTLNAGGEDAFVAQFNASGTRQWTRQIGTTATDRATDVAVDKNGAVYIVGNSDGTITSGGGGGSDLFVLKFDSSGMEQ